MRSPSAEPVLAWYSAHARDLPWRAPDASPWSVLVSEIMLQQTPVSRVLPAHRAWLARWPSPSALAADPAGEAVRQWGRLGYPRRALRLHETATIITRDHAGEVPSSHEALLALPGIGRYTAAAVAAFAFGQRHAVLDTNVRRVLARLASGEEFPGQQPSAAEYLLAESLLPEDPAIAARWSVAVMELGALTCTAARPKCGTCPVSSHCKWLANGSPPATIRPAGQRYQGTDRQCRGRLLALLRDSPVPVPPERFDIAWPDTPQRARALDGLVSDGLVDPLPDGTFALPALAWGAGLSLKGENMALRAAVAGGGLGGMAAAVALTQAGIDVQVYEQAQQLTEVGAGVSLAPNGLRTAERLGIGDGIRRVGARYASAQLLLFDGRPVRHEPAEFVQPGRNVGIHRADLLALLAGQLPPGTVRTGHRCTAFSQDDGGAMLGFADGTTATADVVIGADGIHSVLQGFVGDPAEPVFSGVVAYRGLVPRPDAHPGDALRIWTGEGRHFLTFPVRAGQLLNYVGFVPSDTSVRESWSAPGDPAALAAHFAGWDPAIGEIIAAISGPGGSGFQWAMYDRAPLPRWSSGRLTLLGDAAHPMLPHLAQGANQALEDAVTLATLLGACAGPADVPRALAAYEELRRDRTARIQSGSRQTGAGYDNSGTQLTDRRWIYDHDAYAAAVALT